MFHEDKLQFTSTVFAYIPLIKGSHMAKLIQKRIQKDIEDTDRKIPRGMVIVGCQSNKPTPLMYLFNLQHSSLSERHFEALTFIAFGPVISPLGVCPKESI